MALSLYMILLHISIYEVFAYRGFNGFNPVLDLKPSSFNGGRSMNEFQKGMIVGAIVSAIGLVIGELLTIIIINDW